MAENTLDVVYGHVSHLSTTKLKQARWNAMSGIELSGFLETKLPNKGRRIGTWKAWRKRWCFIKKEKNNVSLQIGAGTKSVERCLFIPQDAILYRTESRSKIYAFAITQPKLKDAIIYLSGESETETQTWMSNIRNMLKPPQEECENDFEISLIDNEHSRKAGLAGLYGRLAVTPQEIIIKDVSTNKSKVTWNWSHINYSYLPLPKHPEDVHRICSICTSVKFKAGEGELDIFCWQADELHSLLSSCPRQTRYDIPRIVSTPLPPTPPEMSPVVSRNNMRATRRMSRSENDLHGRGLQDILAGANLQRSNKLFLLSTQNVSSRTTSNILLAGINYLISTPGCSEPDSLHELQFSPKMRLKQMCQYNSIEEDSDSDYGESIQYEELRGGEKGGKWEGLPESHPTAPPPLPPRSPNREQNKSDKSVEKRKIISYSPLYASEDGSRKYFVAGNLQDKLIVSQPIPI